MQRAWAATVLCYLAFGLIMACMTLFTLLILVFFLPFVGLKALWLLLLRPPTRPASQAQIP